MLFSHRLYYCHIPPTPPNDGPAGGPACHRQTAEGHLKSGQALMQRTLPAPLSPHTVLGKMMSNVSSRRLF